MKIGILTYHDGPNHGAFLQAWSTLQILLKAGHDVEIINYKNARHHEMESSWSFRKLKNPIFAWQMYRKHRAFCRAHKEFKLGPLVTDGDILRQKYYDAVVIGSDVVWNYQIFGYDPVFFGRLNTARRIAFSASFGSVKMVDSHPEEMSADLAKFEKIAVRDENSRHIIENSINEDVCVTLDPTLIYDFTEDLPSSIKPSAEAYLLVYSYRHPIAVVEKVRYYAKSHQLEIHCVGYPPPLRAPRYCKKVHLALNPFEWIQYFKYAQTIMTCTFHGVIFSIKARKPFFYITNDKAHNRVSSLLDQCGIHHDLKLAREDELLFFNPDYDEVYQILEPLTRASRTWLLDSVGSGQICSES